MKNFRSHPTQEQHPNGHLIHAAALTVVLSFPMLCEAVSSVFAAEKTPPIVDQVVIHHHEINPPYSYTLPIYQVGDIRFVSGGVGIEEREAVYPSFSVKLILAEHPRAFLSHVSILIKDSEGHEVLNIPQELVTGPWVFVNLPAGQYHVSGKNQKGVSKERTIRVKAEGTQVHHFIWPAS